jgi:hypothetical protein
MCAPALAMILSIGVAAAGAQANYAAKMADYNAKSAAWRQNVVNSEAAARDEQSQIIRRQLEEQAKTTQKKHVSFVEEAQKVAKAEVSAAAGGVSGVSVDAIVSDIAGKSQMNRTYADTNYKFIVADTQQQLKATDTRLMSRINSVERPLSPADTRGIEILGAVAGGIGKLGSSPSGASLNI